MKKLTVALLSIIFIFTFSVLASAETESESADQEAVVRDSVFILSETEKITVNDGETETELLLATMNIDLNGDRKTSSADARLILRHTAKIELFDGNTALINANCDGAITAIDARLVLRFAAKLDVYYRTADGRILQGMFTSDGRIFMLDENGAATTGIKTIDGFNYYFEKGIAAKGEKRIKGTLWFFADNGKGITGTETVDGVDIYFVDGKSFSGYKDNIYYADGVPANGTYTIDGITYTFENGVSHTGYITVDGKKIYYVNGTVANGFADISGKTYLFTEGKITYGWRYVSGSYYHLDRATGVLAKDTTVDGIRVGTDGKAVSSSYNNEKIKTFMKAREIVEKVTAPSDSVADKKLKCFRWVMSFPYRQYRFVGASMKQQGWEMLFANDIFINGSGCCGSTSAAFAFLAVECGCQDVYFCDDGVSTDGHAWVTMEGNNRVYDVVFAKSKGFNSNYDAVAGDYRRTPPRKTYIGG